MDNKIKVGIIGSCATRDIFTTKYNESYKNYFNLIFSHERISLISLFQNPLKFNDEDLKIYPENGKNKFRTKNLKNDFNKSFFEDFKKGIDYLILDMFFESIFGVIIFENNIITNNTWDLPFVPFYNKITSKQTCTIYENNEEYFKMWSEACDKLFDFIKDYPNIKIVLNKINLTYKLIDEDSSYSTSAELKKIVDIHNKYIKQFEEYIEQKHDVYIIENHDILFTGANSAWDPYVVHFSEDNYKKLFLELCKLCEFPQYDLIKLELEYLKSRLTLDEKIIEKNILRNNEKIKNNPQKTEHNKENQTIVRKNKKRQKHILDFIKF